MDTAVIVAIVLSVLAVVLVVGFFFWHQSKHWGGDFTTTIADNSREYSTFPTSQAPSVWSRASDARRAEIIHDATQGTVKFNEANWAKIGWKE